MGYSVVTTVLQAAVSTLLTDLPTVKDELSIKAADTSNDAWLTRAITQASRAIAVYTKRKFAPEYVQDLFDVEQDPYPYQTPGGFPQLELTRWPVLAVVAVVQTLAPASSQRPATTQALVQDLDFRLEPVTGRLLRLNAFTGVATLWEAMPVTVTYTAGFGALIEDTDTVPASSPYQVTVAEAGAFSCGQSVSYASGAALALVAANPDQGQYSLEAGAYSFNPADAGQPLAFAYATFIIPADLTEICLRLITMRFRARGRDPLLMQRESQQIGVERFWVGGSPGQTGQFPADIEGALNEYRTPTLA